MIDKQDDHKFFKIPSLTAKSPKDNDIRSMQQSHSRFKLQKDDEDSYISSLRKKYPVGFMNLEKRRTSQGQKWNDINKEIKMQDSLYPK